ncbi:MAG: hypothetical protein AB7P99_14250 [Vicinamibacterales bacterium]
MAFTVGERIKETSVTTGTGTYGLDGAVAGHQAFAVLGAGNLTAYVCTDNVAWEVGIGTVSVSPNQLARTTILASSNAGAAVNWGAGTREIGCALPAALAVILGQGGGPAVVSAFIKTLLDDANAAAALTTLGVSAFVQTLLDDTTAAAFLTTLGISAFVQTALDDANAATFRATIGADFEAGTRTTFNQSAAPTGWTKETNAAYNDAAFRIVTGSASSGGANAFSTVMAQTVVGSRSLSVSGTNTAADTWDQPTGGLGANGRAWPQTAGAPPTFNWSGSITPNGHDHAITMNIKYIDMIVAQKN